MRNEQKFLVTWIEDNGFIRGQTAKTSEEAWRCFDHVTKNTNPQYAEIRHIGARITSFYRFKPNTE